MKLTVGTFHRSAELREKIEILMASGLRPKEAAAVLGISHQRCYYHLRAIGLESTEMAMLRSQLADALTREKFLLDLVHRLSRRLLWKTELRQPMPIIRRSR